MLLKILTRNYEKLNGWKNWASCQNIVTNEFQVIAQFKEYAAQNELFSGVESPFLQSKFFYLIDFQNSVVKPGPKNKNTQKRANQKMDNRIPIFQSSGFTLLFRSVRLIIYSAISKFNNTFPCYWIYSNLE